MINTCLCNHSRKNVDQTVLEKQKWKSCWNAKSYYKVHNLCKGPQKNRCTYGRHQQILDELRLLFLMSSVRIGKGEQRNLSISQLFLSVPVPFPWDGKWMPTATEMCVCVQDWLILTFSSHLEAIAHEQLKYTGFSHTLPCKIKQ